MTEPESPPLNGDTYPSWWEEFCPNCGQRWVSIFDTLEYVYEQDGDYARPVFVCRHGELSERYG